VVAADGRMPFPLIGEVQVSGLTQTELEGRLCQLLGKDYLVDPQVSLTVQEYRSQKVFVMGEAEKPGTYPLTGRVTLLDVLSQAGGPSKTAERQVVVVRFPRSEAPGDPGHGGQHDHAREPREAS
jgi:polysaccharide export outer membrane protein